MSDNSIIGHYPFAPPMKNAIASPGAQPAPRARVVDTIPLTPNIVEAIRSAQQWTKSGLKKIGF